MSVWNPYGVNMRGVTIKQVHELSQAQCDSMAELTERLTPGQRLAVQQTWTETGGTHLYAKLPEGSEFHIAVNGNITDLGS